MSYVLTIDQGTTGTTLLLVDESGETVARAYRELNQIYPRPGWVEHDPIEIWNSVLELIDEIIEGNEIVPGQIKSIGITNQRETTVVWDAKSGDPVHNAIVWQCRRTSRHCDELREKGYEKIIREKTGLVIDPYFSATKLAWIMDNVRPTGDIMFGNIDSWLIWRMTGGKVHATDQTNASRTMIYNINKCRWDQDLIDLFGIGSVRLPDVFPSSASFGVCREPASISGVPICGVAGDQQASLFGQACFEIGEAKNTYGTGCFLMVQTGDVPVFSESGLLTTLACSLSDEPKYALEGSVFITGAAVQWIRDGLNLIDSADQTEEMALSVPDTGGVSVVPAFTGLGAPYWDSDARGAILGITRGTRKEHIVRATLESIAHQVADVIEVMQSDAAMPVSILRVDGGGSVNNFLMQFQADILGVSVERSLNKETTALGAAYLAGIESGLWSSPEEIRSFRKIDRLFSPQMSDERRRQLRSEWREAVSRVLTK